MQELNIPDVKAEMEVAFMRYEKALNENDIAEIGRAHV